MAKKLTIVSEGVVNKLAMKSLGESVVSQLCKMLNPDGTFKDAKTQMMFENWKKTPEGQRYA